MNDWSQDVREWPAMYDPHTREANAAGDGYDAEPDEDEEESSLEERAELYASREYGACRCGNNGGGDCDWCMAKRDYLENAEEWRREADGR